MTKEILLDGDAKLIRELAREKICGIEKKIKKLDVEKKEIENMISTCLDCNGLGKVRVIPIYTHSYTEECGTCSGTGKWQK